MILDRDELRDLFHALLRQQEETGAKMAANEYYTDAFHPGGPHNVGKDVLDAVTEMRTAGDEVLRDKQCEMMLLLIRLRAAKKHYAGIHGDPDGYGSATFSEVLGKLSAPEDSIHLITANPTAVPARSRKPWWRFW